MIIIVFYFGSIVYFNRLFGINVKETLKEKTSQIKDKLKKKD